jgi:hypothetical protein
MHELRQELAVIKNTVEQGFAAERRLFEAFRQEQTVRHDDNRDRLERIEEHAKHTNGRVTRHDEQIRTLFKGKGTDVLTLRQVWIYLGCVGFGGYSVWWALTVLLGFHR